MKKTERQALKSLTCLRKQKHLVFQKKQKQKNKKKKKTDKSRGVVIISKHNYIHESETMLKGNQYTEIYADMTSETVNLLKTALPHESIDQHTYDYLYTKEHKIGTPHCYFLPKIHKITSLLEET